MVPTKGTQRLHTMVNLIGLVIEGTTTVIVTCIVTIMPRPIRPWSALVWVDLSAVLAGKLAI